MVRLEGFVLAGGLGRRMGADKARVACRGLPMAAAVAEVLAEVVDTVTLVRRGSDPLPWVDRTGAPLRCLREPHHPSRHPLFGVAAALTVATSDVVLLAPCDLPGLQVHHLDALVADGAPCVATGPDGRVHPLLAVVPRAWQPRAEQLAREGAPARALTGALPEVRLPAEAVRDVNHRHALGATPLERLASRIPPGEARDVLLRGEVERQAAWGIVDPFAPGGP